MDVATAVTRPQSFWASVREALRGGHHDYTETEISRAIFLLAIPMVLEMSMESLFGLVDIYFVAHLGADAPATVALEGYESNAPMPVRCRRPERLHGWIDVARNETSAP